MPALRLLNKPLTARFRLVVNGKADKLKSPQKKLQTAKTKNLRRPVHRLPPPHHSFAINAVGQNGSSYATADGIYRPTTALQCFRSTFNYGEKESAKGLKTPFLLAFRFF